MPQSVQAEPDGAFGGRDRQTAARAHRFPSRQKAPIGLTSVEQKLRSDRLPAKREHARWAPSPPRTARRSTTRTGAPGSRGLQPRLAAERGRLGRPDVLPGLARLPLHRPRPPRPRPLQPAWNGNDLDTYADDLAALIEALDLQGRRHVGHSTGGGEVARYIGRHGTKRVAKAVLISAIPPLMLKTAANPGGLPIEVFDGIRAGVLADRSQFYQDLSRAVLRRQPARLEGLAGRARCVLAVEHAGRHSRVPTTASRPSRRPISPKT